MAPGSVVAGLLYYVGRTYTSAYYTFLGVPTSDLQLSYHSYLTISPNALFFPLWFLLTCGLLAMVLFALIEPRLVRPRALRLRRRVCLGFALSGGLLLLLGFVVFLQPPWWSHRVLSRLAPGWPRDLVPSLVVAVGAGLAISALHLYRAGRRRRSDSHDRVWTLVGAVLIGMLTLSLFFDLARYADAAGVDQAARDSYSQPAFPSHIKVLIYSRSRITHNALGITLDDLGSDNEPYRYRYRGFTLLAKSSSRYYLVSHARRSSRDVTVVVPDNDGIRIETLG